MIRLLRFFLIVPILLALGMSGAAWADPPARVGRLSVVAGDVSLRTADSADWEMGQSNWPITTGDALATESGGRAEVRVGSSVIRMDESTALSIEQLDDDRIRVRLDYGSIGLRVRSRDETAAIEVETPDGRVITDEPGQYRVDYRNGTSSLTTYRGRLDFRSPDSHAVIADRQRADVWSPNGTELRWGRPERDEFSDWNLARDERDDERTASRHVSPEMTGVEDLYEYGDWQESGDYGPVWYPRHVSPGWAPYRSGRWVVVQPWGRTWVDDAPWGFAPFHYGRWVQLRGRWAWVPGTYVKQPVYAPALVVWINSPSVSIRFSSGGQPSVGWYPLGPREVFVPAYRHSPAYVREVNVTHVTNVVRIREVVREPERGRHMHRDRREAVTVVPVASVEQPRPRSRHAEREHERRDRRVAVPPVQESVISPERRREVEHNRRYGENERIEDDPVRAGREADRRQRQRDYAPPADVEREQGHRERGQREQAQREQAQREQAQREQAQREQAQREQAQREQGRRHNEEAREHAQRAQEGRDREAREQQMAAQRDAERVRSEREVERAQARQRQVDAQHAADQEHQARREAQRQRRDERTRVDAAAMQESQRAVREPRARQDESAAREQQERRDGRRRGSPSDPQAGEESTRHRNDDGGGRGRSGEADDRPRGLRL